MRKNLRTHDSKGLPAVAAPSCANPKPQTLVSVDLHRSTFDRLHSITPTPISSNSAIKSALLCKQLVLTIALSFTKPTDLHTGTGFKVRAFGVHYFKVRVSIQIGLSDCPTEVSCCDGLECSGLPQVVYDTGLPLASREWRNGVQL